jgi:hypothetical protein
VTAAGGDFASCMLEERPVLHFGSELCDLAFQASQPLHKSFHSLLGDGISEYPLKIRGSRLNGHRERQALLSQ